MGSISPSAQYSSPSTTPNIAERAPWHSPLPYLFGGLAAMLSLIAFALVILACSYWNLSRRDRDRDSADLENGGAYEAKIDSEIPPEKANYDENILVIMAGNQNPTFLARPVCIKVSSAVETAVNGKSEVEETAENSEKSIKVNDPDVNSAVEESGEEVN
ncbi:protein GLUTAMINE DUMPER 5-like [Benincasa hispida]|uniref:protein GLUTAMINE DUMPER 5-like n=1 Tax=Benincasa hispida TaxID=102211 RepID=UPI0019027663|nr:protein GLUTAMINE DUMPER 5-like [Benincasa hispida]